MSGEFYQHIVQDREFSSSKQLLNGKAKQLCLAGGERRPNKAWQVSEEEEEILWEEQEHSVLKTQNLSLNNLVAVSWFLRLKTPKS